jgi:hypothetical protein
LAKMGVELTFSVSVSGLEREWERGSLRKPFATLSERKKLQRGVPISSRSILAETYMIYQRLLDLLKYPELQSLTTKKSSSFGHGNFSAINFIEEQHLEQINC